MVGAQATVAAAAAAWVAVVVATVAGIIALRQFRTARGTAHATLLLELDKLIRSFSDLHKVLASDYQPTSADLTDDRLRDYIGTFERVHILLRLEVIDINTVDHLYYYRIAKLAQNEFVREEFRADPESWQDFILLWALLKKHQHEALDPLFSELHNKVSNHPPKKR
jgi:hypothetical protein